MAIHFQSECPILRTFQIQLMRVNSSQMSLPTIQALLLVQHIRSSTSNGRIMCIFRQSILFLRLIISKISKLHTSLSIRPRPDLLRLTFSENSRLNSMNITQAFHLIRLLLSGVMLLTINVFRQRIFRFTFSHMRTRTINRQNM